MKNDENWPFEAWLKIVVLQFGLSPEDFWKMSLKDWVALTRSTAPKPMGKSDLIKLEQDYEQS